MKREDAFYHKLLLMSGLDDGYDEWLNYYLELENPLSNIVLELACCGSDINKTISVLHNFCAEQPFDKSDVCNRVRLFYKNAYYSKRMSTEEIVSSMYRLANNIGDPGDADFDAHIWGDMYYLDDYYDLAIDGLIPMEGFNVAFFSYLDNGISIDSNSIWNYNKSKNTSLIDRIKHFLNKIIN
ncbi:MAG: hypothetical protein IIW56_10735 [Oscillospiraceae bacterium]|nr:hypothetical protein [Oscillospiraceae bacterium]